MAEQLSEAIHQITDADTEGLGYFGQSFQVNALFGALDLADIIPRQVRLFREFFLAETRSHTFMADRFSQDFVKAHT